MWEGSRNDWMILQYCISIPVMVAFALLACIYTAFWGVQSLASNDGKATENFITARKSQGKWRIGWSFFAGSMGAWVIVSPASYASYAGLLGLCFYSFAAGMPLMVRASALAEIGHTSS